MCEYLSSWNERLTRFRKAPQNSTSDRTHKSKNHRFRTVDSASITKERSMVMRLKFVAKRDTLGFGLSPDWTFGRVPAVEFAASELVTLPRLPACRIESLCKGRTQLRDQDGFNCPASGTDFLRLCKKILKYGFLPIKARKFMRGVGLRTDLVAELVNEGCLSIQAPWFGCRDSRDQRLRLATHQVVIGGKER